MKHSLIIILFLIAGLMGVSAQSCSDDKFVVHKQADIDSFAVVYGQCSIMPKMQLIIHDTEDLDYSKLDFLEEVSALRLFGHNSSRTFLSGFNKINRVHDEMTFSGFKELEHIDVLESATINILTFLNLDSLKSIRVASPSIAELKGFALFQCPSLESLNGFPTLTAVNAFSISSQVGNTWEFPESLKSIKSFRKTNSDRDGMLPFHKLDTIGSFSVSSNRFLTSLEGIHDLEVSTGDDLPTVSLFFNFELQDCYNPYFCRVLEANGKLEISNNGKDCMTPEEIAAQCTLCAEADNGEYLLNSQDAVDQYVEKYAVCKWIEGGVHIIGDWDLRGMSPIKRLGNIHISSLEEGNLNGLHNLKEVKNLRIDKSSELKDIEGLNGLEKVHNKLTIYGMESLERLSFLSSLKSVGKLEINQYGGSNLNGLDSLNSIKEELGILNNAALVDLDGLGHIEVLPKQLTLQHNIALEDISAIGARDLELAELSITANPQLSICNHSGICSFLNEPPQGSEINITGNKEGCNSEQEVLEACQGGTSTADEEVVDLRIFPNPTSGHIFIAGDQASDEIRIVSLLGKEVQLYKGVERVLDLGSLPQGIYVIQVYSKDSIVWSQRVVRVE